MMETAMDQAHFLKRLEAYGADLSAWPADEREAAAAFLADASAEVRAEVTEAAALDRVLEEAAPAQASGALLGRVLQSAPRREPRRPLGLAAPWRSWRARAVLAAVGALAVSASSYAGWTTSRIAAEEAARDAFVAALELDAFGDLYEPLEVDG